MSHSYTQLQKVFHVTTNDCHDLGSIQIVSIEDWKKKLTFNMQCF